LDLSFENLSLFLANGVRSYSLESFMFTANNFHSYWWFMEHVLSDTQWLLINFSLFPPPMRIFEVDNERRKLLEKCNEYDFNCIWSIWFIYLNFKSK
jgi:hypothetical protein